MYSSNPNDVEGLPEESPTRWSRSTLVLWLLVLGLAILFLPLSLLASTVRQDISHLEVSLVPMQATLTAVFTATTPGPEAQVILNNLAQVEAQIGQIEAVRPTIAAGQQDWQAIAAAIAGYNPAEVSLSSMSQEGDKLTLYGRAVNDLAVIGYARELEASGLFADVVVQSITANGTPFVTAAPTGQPTAATPATPGAIPTPGPTVTATVDPRDAFEVDDFQAVPIFLGQPQTRNFYPIFDVDAVHFLAKAGRFYRVATLDLAPGVDTYLNVTVGATLYTNDDVQSGTLASEVRFQATTLGDSQATVRVTNRGAYGPEMGYLLVVEELVPTPSPTTTGTPAPTSTNTPAPTPTPTATLPPATATSTAAPTATPTPTPDLRDVYEPDDNDPKPIAIGETQSHNFLPTGDVDKVRFIVKEGRYYTSFTSNLALGVDTFIVADLNGQQWSNDDYDAPGSGNFASAVCFPAAADGEAVVTITNLAQQFGSDKSYQVAAAETVGPNVNPWELDFGQVVVGAANPAPQSVVITGTTALTWTATADSGWISVDPAGGSTPATMSVSVDVSGLTPGSYTGTVSVWGASSCTQSVTVSVDVVPAGGQANFGFWILDFGEVARIQNPKSKIQNPSAVEFVIVLQLGP